MCPSVITYSSILSTIHPFILIFIHTFIYSSIYLPIRPYISMFIHTFIYSSIHTYSSIHFNVHPYIIYSSIHLPIHTLFIHPYIYLFIHMLSPFIHTPIQSIHFILYTYPCIHSLTELEPIESPIVRYVHEVGPTNKQCPPESCKYLKTDWRTVMIMCQSCETWYHSMCVKVLNCRARFLAEFICPTCRGL